MRKLGVRLRLAEGPFFAINLNLMDFGPRRAAVSTLGPRRRQGLRHVHVCLKPQSAVVGCIAFFPKPGARAPKL